MTENHKQRVRAQATATQSPNLKISAPTVLNNIFHITTQQHKIYSECNSNVAVNIEYYKYAMIWRCCPCYCYYC